MVWIGLGGCDYYSTFLEVEMLREIVLNVRVGWIALENLGWFPTRKDRSWGPGYRISGKRMEQKK